MKKIEEKFQAIRTFCTKNYNEDNIKKYGRFFKEGYDAYGLDQSLFESQLQKWIDDWETDMTFDDYLLLGDKLISTGKYEEASYAIQFIWCQKDVLKKSHFKHLEKWLENGICNWGHTDVMCYTIWASFISEKIVDENDFQPWVKSSSKWKRRAVPVTFYQLIKDGRDSKLYFPIIDLLMLDKEEDVQKGLGTFLREYWKKYPKKTESFLMKWKDTCGRKIIQYATEKMDKEYRKKFRKKK